MAVRVSSRRVVLFVQENSDDLLFHAFFLVTNLQQARLSAREGAGPVPQGHMGELKSALDVHLSSTDHGASTVQQVMVRNQQVSLLLSLYAYQVLHGLRAWCSARLTKAGA